MKVILCENVDNLGEMGQTVKVSAGYARNFLFPRNLAVGLDSANAKQIEHEKQKIKRKEERFRNEMTAVAKEIEKVTVEIKARAGEGDKLFGSVTSGHIADELKALGHEVDKKSIQLSEPIKSLGIFPVPVRLASGIIAEVKVWVTGEQLEEESEPAEAPAE